jgi:ubiquinone/menaquinone biosynthesis C-methylase UbiE
MKACAEGKPYTIPLPTGLPSFLKDRSARSVLEIGCGYGRASFFLRRSGLEVVGVDFDLPQIKLALEGLRRRNLRQGISFLASDARCLCFSDDSFDAVTMLGVLTLASKDERLGIMSEVERVLKPSAYLFVEEFGRTWKNKVYTKRYRDDFEISGELGTIVVKDETGKILHFGHHFTEQEIRRLFRDFDIISLEKDIFTSYYHRNWVNGYVILARKTS